tara:strand:- start:224 stop:610 length:387 start_codon:yes stop_codon:yes gene_type:complete
MATLTKTLTLTSAAGDILSDSLALSMTQDVTINAASTMKKFNLASGTDTTVATAVGQSIVYLKNSTGSTRTIKIFSDGGGDGAGAATELVLEILDGEFAVLPAALDYALLANAVGGTGVLEVGVFTKA